MSYRIKKRDLRPYVLNWLTVKLELGDSIGEIFYMAEDGTAIYQNLLDNGVPDDRIYHTLASAYAATTTRQNDVILVTTGSYEAGGVTSWAHSNTHLVGLSGPNVAVPVGVTNPSYYQNVVNSAASGGAYASVMDVTGEYCQFHGINFQNLYNSASCLKAVSVAGEGNYFKNCNFVGGSAATPAATDKSCSLEIGDDAGCSRFDDCSIGTPHGTARSSAHNGALYFSGIARRSPRGYFNRCNFHVRVGATTVSAIRNDGCDRSWVFTDCFFEGFSDNYATACAEAIHENAFATTHCFFLRRCSAVGFTTWCVNQSGYPHYTLTSDPITGTASGLGVAAEGTVGT